MNKRFKSIDLIKGIAIIMVILVHYEQSFKICKWFSYLQHGCSLFFVASGFAISCLICNKYNGSITKYNLMSFYKSRIKALWPAWFLAFVIIYFTNSILIILAGKCFPFGSNRGIISIICNLLFLNGLLPFCNNNVMPGGWYVGTTIILYAITPFVYKLFNRFKNKFLFFINSSFVMIIIWIFIFILFKDKFVNEQGFAYHSFLIHYPSYLLGFILYDKQNKISMNQKNNISHIIIGIFLFVIAFIIFYRPIEFGIYFSSWVSAIATYMILRGLISHESINVCFLKKILISYGRNSYYIYLMHVFVVGPFILITEYIFNYFGLSIKNILGFIFMMPVVIILSYYVGDIFRKILDVVSSYFVFLFKNRCFLLEYFIKK